MKYAFTCQCGKTIPVEAFAAGSEIACGCGLKSHVPRLSQLRVMSGEGDYGAGTVDTILRMLDEGTLPWGGSCAVSGLPTTDQVELYVECERLHFKNSKNDWFVVAILISPLIALFVKPAMEDSQPLGRETRVRTPLRVAREQHEAVSSMRSQRRLRRLLRQVPIDDRLLKDYPKARIFIGALPVNPGMKLDPSFAG